MGAIFESRDIIHTHSYNKTISLTTKKLKSKLYTMKRNLDKILPRQNYFISSKTVSTNFTKFQDLFTKTTEDVNQYFNSFLNKTQTNREPPNKEPAENKEKREQIKQERFFQRVQLSKYTHEIVDRLKVSHEKILNIDRNSRSTDSSFSDQHYSEDDVNSIEYTVNQLKVIAQLFTQQPESVLMAIRFNFHILLPKLEKQLSRLIPESKFCETTTTIAGTDLSVQYKRACSVCHVLMGHAHPPNGKAGIRILTLDSGGSKGVVTLEVLKKLEESSGGRPIHELFDYISGTSTGAILAFLVGVQKRPLCEVEKLYTEMSVDIWGTTNLLEGGSRLLRSHAYYDSEKWDGILQDLCGDMTLLESGIDRDCPRFACISTLVNRSRSKPYLWRNYNLLGYNNLEKLQHPGTANAEYWKAIRASTAAPGFFKEVRVNVKGIRIANTEWDIHQDGGLIANNPAAVAIGECKALWPGHKIQSVVSIGTGRFEPVFGEIKETSIQNKLSVIVNSATNTHNVHSMMYETLPSGVYFRFDPYLSEAASINVWQTDKIESLKTDARKYCRKNESKFIECTGKLDKMTNLEKKWNGGGRVLTWPSKSS